MRSAWRRPVEEVRVAEVDVAGAGRHLTAHVVQHDLGGDGEEAAAVDGRNRAVTADVLAAARRLGVPRDAALARDRQARVALERRQPVTRRDQIVAPAG